MRREKSSNPARLFSLPPGITEEDITAFCGPCDNLKPNNICSLPVMNYDQTRYVARGFCGYVVVEGKVGKMTNSGFEPFWK